MTTLVSRGPVAGMTPRSLGAVLTQVKTTVLARKNPSRGFYVAVFALKNPGGGSVLTVFTLKNLGRVDRAHSQKPGAGVWADRARSQKTLVGFCVRSQKPGSGVCLTRVFKGR